MRKVILLFIMISSVYMNGQGVSKVFIDLSETNVLSKSENIKKGNKKIIIKYLVHNPDYYYTIDSDIETTIYEPFDFNFSPEGNENSDSIAERAKNNVNCDRTNEIYQELEKKYTAYVNSLSLVKSESHLKDSINNKELSSLIDSISEFDFGNCKINKKVIKGIEEISKYFQHEVNIEGLEKGQKITIYIKKFNKETHKVVQEWKRIYKTPIRGKWVTSFGIGSAIQIKLNTFRTVENPDQTGEYIIEPDGRRNPFQYMPAIQFSYLNNLSGDLEIAPSGGLSFASNQIAAYGGISLVFAQNMILTAGATFHSKYKLKNKYKENDILDSKLEFNDLHDRYYGISPFISLSFRFKNNPFSKENQ